jgi:HlyD family secretion protein
VIGLIIVVCLAGGLLYAFWPQPIPVDLTRVAQGELQVTIAGEGQTRVKNVYVVSAPISGYLLRIDADAGDDVRSADTVLATIQPIEPEFLDIRSRRQAEASVKAAEASLAVGEADHDRVAAELDFAISEQARARSLARRGTISAAQLDRAKKDVETLRAALATAKAALRMKRFELENAHAALIDPGADAAGANDAANCCVPVRAPVNGKVLRLMRESEGVIRAGAPLLEVGDPRNLEVVVDLLSSDAVKVREGAAVLIEDWGGPGILTGQVRRVEPYGFTKVSALGIEEQRVNVIIDLLAEPAKWRRLGHGYRVNTRIIVWREEGVAQLPLAALFRDDDRWAVFAAVKDRAVLHHVELGRIGSDRAQLLSGVDVGAQIILHPNDRIGNGTTITPRQTTSQ